MTELIERFQEIDKDLAGSIDVKIEPVMALEEIESGSITVWLRSALDAVEDSALKNLNWKPAVGKYLVKTKYLLINFLDNKTEISNRDEIENLSSQLLKAAQETDVRRIPTYSPVPTWRVLEFLCDISRSLEHLSSSDTAQFSTREGDEASFNLSFQYSPESLQELLTKETLTSTQEMILKVKKPDYLGSSMWDFRHEGRTLQAKIEDEQWLHNFQSRGQDVRPGDALRAKVVISVNYGYDGEVVETRYNIIEVIKTVPQSEQITLDLGPEPPQ